jgi:hypothetical protein
MDSKDRALDLHHRPQYLLVRLDEERALRTLPKLLGDDDVASKTALESANLAVRWRLARKPTWRIRWKPWGTVCCRKRRMNLSAAISFTWKDYHRQDGKTQATKEHI